MHLVRLMKRSTFESESLQSRLLQSRSSTEPLQIQTESNRVIDSNVELLVSSFRGASFASDDV